MRTKTKKILTAVLACLLVACIGIGGSLAFLTDSEKETNTFTVGRVDIILEEPNWDDTTDGKDVTPGTTQIKDPTVTEVEGSSYMRMIVTIYDTETGEQITDEDRLDLILQTIRYDGTYAPAASTPGTALVERTSYTLADLTALPMVNPAFTEVAAKSTAGQYYFNYNDILNEGDKATLFTNIVIPSDWNQLQLDLLGQFQIEVLAQAIQSDTFDNADAAFAALDAEVAASTILEDYGEVGASNSGDQGLVVSGVVPEGAVYYTGVTNAAVGNYEGAAATYEAGAELPQTPETGDVVVLGDYEYRYNMYCTLGMGFVWESNPAQNGWGVRVLDDTKDSYGEIASTISGCPITNMRSTFTNCTKMTVAPAIPSNVINMADTFVSCISLTTAPAIPASVSAMPGSFSNCMALTGEIEINANPTSYAGCFDGTMQAITITGSATDATKVALAATATNGNVTY